MFKNKRKMLVGICNSNVLTIYLFIQGFLTFQIEIIPKKQTFCFSLIFNAHKHTRDERYLAEFG